MILLTFSHRKHTRTLDASTIMPGNMIDVGGDITLHRSDHDRLVEMGLSRDFVRGPRIQQKMERALGQLNGQDYVHGGGPFAGTAVYPEINNTNMKVKKIGHLQTASCGRHYQFFQVRGARRDQRSNGTGQKKRRKYYVVITQTGAACSCQDCDEDSSCKHILLTLRELGISPADITDPMRHAAVVQAVEDYFGVSM